MKIFDLGGKQAANATVSNVDILGVAAATSAVKGVMSEIVDKVAEGSYNRNLANKVINEYKHASIFEHAVFTICLEDVSLAFEQFLIEHRLISITIKSRRYVNFLDAGVVSNTTDIDISPDINERVEKHVNELFDAYNEAVNEGGMAVEYARYILPIGTCSNIILTINAREIVNVLENILEYHRDNDEFMQIARGILCLVNKTYPVEFEPIHERVFNEESRNIKTSEKSILDTIEFNNGSHYVKYGRGNIDIPVAHKIHELMHIPVATDRAIEFASMFYLKEILGFNEVAAKDILSLRAIDIPKHLVKCNHKVLEMIGSTMMDKITISISSLTHLTRHRMQTLFVPEFRKLLPTYALRPHYLEIGRCNVLYNKESTPECIAKRSSLKIWSMIKKNRSIVAELHAVMPDNVNVSYLMTGGTMLNVYSIMNFRERALFMQLRKCSRAQTEIREIAKAIDNHNYGGLDILSTRCRIGLGCPEQDKGCK